MSLLPQEIIRLKRDGRALSPTQIEDFIRGVTAGTVGDEQIAALAMAVFFRGMDASEQASLTTAMTHSGQRLDWREAGIDRPVVDKHSTGGVGDKVSLLLAPIVAACGACVPMISGRGLGHTGGTLDKLDSIPGYDSTPTLERFTQITREIGCSIIGQTADLAPADRRIYAVRDITATVESIPLITASILSKKLAAGLDYLVMDVKFGNGAFMDDSERATELARNIIRVAGEAGLPTSALITDMNQVLGRNVGHTLEVLECIRFLNGEDQEPRLRECTLALATEMLRLAGIAEDETTARQQATSALDQGAAAEVFARMVSAHGGPADLLQRPGDHLAVAPVKLTVYPERDGWLQAIDGRAVGNAVVALGGGRTRPDQTIDFRVGLAAVAGIGQRVGPDNPLATVHAAGEASAEQAAAALRQACTVSPERIGTDSVIHAVIQP
ncbi:MAG: thymidine phosphorylase [Wenzhouxiangellaceae bacterium]